MFQEERPVFLEVIISAVQSKGCTYTNVQLGTVFEIELFHCTPSRRAELHNLTKVANCVEADGKIRDNLLYKLKCTNLAT
jgi:hypothetical protein